jgi:hypothetical protein
METPLLATLDQHFGDLTDPRVERTKLHQLVDILVIAICAVIGGADNWEDVEAFGKAKQEWFQTFLELPNGIPSHDTFTPNNFRLALCGGSRRSVNASAAK